MDHHTTFGQRVRALRRAKGLTQTRVAAHVAAVLRALGRRGFTISYLSKIEHGHLPPPSVLAILALAEALDTPSDALLALAGKAPEGLGHLLTTSPAARQFYQRAQALALRDDQWQALQGCLDTLEESEETP